MLLDHVKWLTLPECSSNSAMAEFVATSYNIMLPKVVPNAIISKLSPTFDIDDFNFFLLCPL